MYEAASIVRINVQSIISYPSLPGVFTHLVLDNTISRNRILVSYKKGRATTFPQNQPLPHLNPTSKLNQRSIRLKDIPHLILPFLPPRVSLLA